MSLSKNPEITKNLKIIYDNINKRINELLIEKIKEVAIEALQKIKPAEEKKEESVSIEPLKEAIINKLKNILPTEEEKDEGPVSIEPLKEAIINKLQDILPKEEDKEKEEDSQKSLIITFQNNPITLPDENVSIEPLKNAVINKLKQIIPDETKEEEVKDVKIEKTEGEPPRIPDFPGVYYYVFPGQGVWPEKNYSFSDSNTQTGGGNPEKGNEEIKTEIKSIIEKNSVDNIQDKLQNIHNLEELNIERKNVIQLFNIYYYINMKLVYNIKNEKIVAKKIKPRITKSKTPLLSQYEKYSENKDKDDVISKYIIE
jgi:hypothetical protein